ncbi:MAG: Hsp20/alpha crystallin family protein [Bacteroidota bacterium]
MRQVRYFRPSHPLAQSSALTGYKGRTRRSNSTKTNAVPKVNILRQKDGFILELMAPGYKKTDFKVELDQEMLTISAKVPEIDTENKATYRHQEFQAGGFTRKFALKSPIQKEAIEANYEQGILRVNLPLVEAATPREVVIQ